MSEKEFISPEAVGNSETQHLIEVVRRLLLPVEPYVFDYPSFDDEGSIPDVSLITPTSTFRVDGCIVAVSESSFVDIDAVDVGAIDVEVMRVGQGGVIVTDNYAVFVNTLQTTFSSRTSGEEKDSDESKALFSEGNIADHLKQFFIRQQVKRIAGDDVFTKERFDELLKLLEQCDLDTNNETL